MSVTTPPQTAAPASDDQVVTKQQWKWSALAGMASYLDAGSIVAIGTGYKLFQTKMGITDTMVGILSAIGPNALGCAIGSVFGGWLGDKLGRKFIYQYDLMLYAAGILCLTLAVNWPMLLIGTFIVGVAVGIDVPTSLALVGELAPAKARGKLLGLTQVAWSLGPVIVLLLGTALSGLGLFGIRIIFFHLFLVAVITWGLRRGLTESVRWKEAAQKTPESRRQIRSLFTGSHLKALVWTTTIYLFWNLAAGTAGNFNPYIISTLIGEDSTPAAVAPADPGAVASVPNTVTPAPTAAELAAEAESKEAYKQAVGTGLSSLNFIIAMVVTIVVFMRYSDRSYRTRKTLWAIGAVMQTVGYGIFLVLPFNIPTVVANITLFACGCALAGEAFYKVFSQELFPTILRGTAQGFTFGVARAILALWSVFVPLLTSLDIRWVAGLLTLFLAISGIVGFFGMPDTSGKSLEQIEAERA